MAKLNFTPIKGTGLPTKDISTYKPMNPKLGTSAYNLESAAYLPQMTPAPRVVVTAKTSSPIPHSVFVDGQGSQYNTTVAAKTVAAKSTTPVVKK